MPQKDLSNVVRGLKAAINNPNVSEEAKERDYERLQEMGFDPHQRAHRSGKADDTHLNRQLGGHKAAIKNPNVSAEAKQRSRRVLEGKAAMHSQTKQVDIGKKSPDNIASQHKVDMKNTRFSEKIKEHAADPVEDLTPQ